MPDPIPANADPLWQRNAQIIDVTNRDGVAVPVRYGASTRNELLYKEYWRDETKTEVHKQLESVPHLIKGDRKKPSIMQYPTEIGSGEVPHVMQFKAYWRWASKDLQKRAAEIKRETEKIVSDLQDLLAIDQKYFTLDPDFIRTNPWGEDQKRIDALMEILNDDRAVNIVDPTLNTTLAELIKSNPTKARDIVQETLRAHQSKLRSIQHEQSSGLGNIMLSEDEIQTLETYAPSQLLAEKEHERLVRRVEELKRDRTATPEQKKEAADALRKFRLAPENSRFRTSAERVTTARGVRIDDAVPGDPVGTGKRMLFGGTVEGDKEKSFSRMGKGGKDSPDTLTTAAQAGENQSIYDQMISIYLPFCNKINNEDTMVYEAEEMKAVGAFLDFLGSPVQTSKQGIKAAGEIGAGTLGQGAAATKFMGVRINPRMEKLFKNKDFRSFNFSWEMYPKNRKEVEQIHNIVEAFRYHGNPSFDRDNIPQDGKDTVAIVLRVPAEFQIRFLSTNPDPGVEGFVENPYIPKIARCVLNSVAVDYTPNSIYSSLKNNAPTAITLTLQFTEIGIITREAIEAGF